MAEVPVSENRQFKPCWANLLMKNLTCLAIANNKDNRTTVKKMALWDGSITRRIN
jgi:hypothetical protein